jgi:hypothetical protein
LAAGEDLGLKSPSAGRHLSVKSWGDGGKAPVRFPLKNRNSRFFNKLLGGYDIAQDPQRPKWKPGDFFGENLGAKN